MRRVQLVNVACVAACVAAAAIIMGTGQGPQTEARPYASSDGPDLRYTTLPDGSRGLIDATGRVVPLKPYRRIVGGSIVARAALGELCERDRIVGVIAAGIADAPDRHRFAGVAQVRGVKETERLLGLTPDLIIVNALSSVSHVQRLRDAGIEVFALGDMRGVRTFTRDLRQVSVLIGATQRGERIARGFQRRMRAVAVDVPRPDRKTGMYLSAYGAQLFGGTKGTSYHDVLTFGGLIDAAAARFSAWPQYTAEHVLSVDPDFIVSPAGVGEQLCAKEPLSRLRACRDGGAGFVELPSSWLEDPSFVMLDVAESIREAVYGAP